MLQNRSLAFKISFFILIGTVITFMVMISLNYYYAKALLSRNVISNTQNMTFSVINSIETVLVSTQKIPLDLALLLDYSELSEEKLNAYMKQIVTYNPEVFGCCVAYEPNMSGRKTAYAPYYYKKNGVVRYIDFPDINYDYMYRDWYQIPKMLDKPMWSEPYYDIGASNIIMSTYSVPFYGIQNGKKVLKGIVAVDISLDWLQELMSKLYIGSGGYAFIISRKGTFVTHPTADRIMNESIFSLAEERNDKSLVGIGKKMVHGETGMAQVFSQTLHQKAWIFFSTLPANKWSMGVVIPDKVLWGDLNHMTRYLVLIGLIGIMFLVLIIIRVIERMIKPLNSLAQSVDFIAKGNFDTEFTVTQTNDEIGILSESFNNMRIAMKSYMHHLIETTATREKFDSELKIAHDIQMNIVPRSFPTLPKGNALEIYALLEPAKAVGGDWYDYFYIDDDHLCFTIGDVSGKGVPAAILMAVIRTYLRAKATSISHVEDIMTAINVETAINNDYMMFATIFIGILNTSNGQLDYCNASHNPPYILQADGEVFRLTEMHGVAVGIFEDRSYTSDSMKINPGDAIILYTDGITEAMNENEDMFGYRNLEKTLQLLVFNDTKTIVENLREEVRKFTNNIEQTDDITIEVIRYLGNG